MYESNIFNKLFTKEIENEQKIKHSQQNNPFSNITIPALQVKRNADEHTHHGWGRDARMFVTLFFNTPNITLQSTHILTFPSPRTKRGSCVIFPLVFFSFSLTNQTHFHFQKEIHQKYFGCPSRVVTAPSTWKIISGYNNILIPNLQPPYTAIPFHIIPHSQTLILKWI